ncbi:MAG: molybdate ABC transporter substrate-binding protein, partial [Bacteroidota bacterium]
MRLPFQYPSSHNTLVTTLGIDHLLRAALVPLLIILLSLVLYACNGSRSNEADGPPPLTIACASNLRSAVEEIAATFEAHTQVSTQVIYSSSGKLTAQITAGAPYDVFLSADPHYLEVLEKAGLTSSSPEVFAKAVLTIWSATNSISPLPDSLTSHRLRKIAVPNPATAPFGRSAMEYLKHRGLDSLLAEKLVFGESVSQTDQFVYS